LTRQNLALRGGVGSKKIKVAVSAAVRVGDSVGELPLLVSWESDHVDFHKTLGSPFYQTLKGGGNSVLIDLENPSGIHLCNSPKK